MKSLFPTLGLEEIKPLHFNPKDERYTLKYIKKEAWVLTNYIHKKRAHKSIHLRESAWNELDSKIAERWGIK